MSVQTRVMVDGRWTTRSLDIHQILARNREEKQEIVDRTPAEQGRPVLGILTRTLIRSPVIKSIIPARIRHRSRNDVVLIYDDAVVIKEVLGGERIEHDPFKDISLEDVVEKRDFDSPIQAARILGLPREPKVPRFPGKFWSQHTDSYTSQSPSEIKPELLHENEVPSQILVLTLASRNLLFLFAYHDVHERVHFLSNTWPLPAQAEDVQELGVHLAVDPKSRAMAVGAHENRVVIYTLKSMEQIRKEVQRQNGLDAKNFMPIHEEQFTEVDGAILKMEFLHPSKGDEHHVILLLVVSKGQRTLLVRFEWDCRAGLSVFERKPSQVLANSERLPLLLIPLTYGTSFALVCEHQITVYKDILTGNARGQTCQLEHYEPPEEPRSSKRLPIWTQWARPMRPTKRREPDIDNIYLCREDGVVCYIDIKETSHPMISSNYSAGILKANLSSAFATLDLGDESNDVLIAAGEMGDGGMWYLKPRQPLELVGTIRNWSPLRDITTAQANGPTSNLARTDNQVWRKAKRLFACSGRGPRHSAITEIRIGTEAVKLGPTIELGELADNGILDLWAMPDRSDIGIYLMIARPTETELILLPSSIDQDPQAASEVEELNLNERTIAAGSTAEGFLVQVTPSSVNAIAQEHGILPLAWHPEEASITAASFLTIPSRTTVLLIVLRRRNDFYLHHGHFGSQGGRIVFEALGEPVRLPSEASSVALHWVENRIIAFVGTLAATLQTYTASAGSGLSPYFEYSFDDPFSICDSLAVLMTKIQAVACEEVEDGQLVVCGLRNGTVRTLWFDGGNNGGSNGGERNIFGTGGFPLLLCESLIFGSISVKVMTDTTRSSRAFAVCGQTVCTLEYLGGASPTNPATINKLWLTDPNSQAFQQGPLTCVAQASSNIPQGYSKFAAGSLFYLTGSSLVLADVSSSPNLEMVPRRLPLIGTPTTVLYSERLGKLIVMYDTTEVHYPGTPLRRGIAVRHRAPQPAIAFVEPDAEPTRLDQDEEDGLNVLDATCVLPGEKFLGLMEWFPTDGTKQYHMLVVHTAAGQAGSQIAIGRLLFFSPVLNAVGDVTLRQKIDLDHKAKICAVAHYGESSLVYGCGNDIFFRFLDLEHKKFKQPMKLTLRSPAVHISVQGLNIHVSTESHGHHVLSVGEDNLVPRWADRTSRSSAYHLVAPEQSLIITTDLECRIAGLWQPPQPQLDRTTPLIFEAFLPRPITKLCRVRRQKRLFQVNQLERQISSPPSPIDGKNEKENGDVAWEERYLPKECMLGTSEDGTVYQLSLVDEASWRLLAFIQNMAMREPQICPYPNPRLRDRDLEPSMARKQDMHIDGDILIRFLERGSRTLLIKMLAVQGPRTRMLLDEMLVENRTEDRCRRLRALATEIFKDDVPSHEETGESVLRWLRSLLMPAI
ncbi:MAG: hypothetical protein L6R42_000202 [Xanthoria sp. 1 TBL-2021]|nr:MAG: hypothetical protein L6R42_000202 [Xanthoria sp. 1 TBL-2021]